VSRSGLRDARRGDAARNDELEIERDFLLKSLQDLDQEHEAGDVSDADYERLHDRYTARAAEVLRALRDADGGPVDGGLDEDGSTDPAVGGDDAAQATGTPTRAGSSRASAGTRTNIAKNKKKSPLLVGGVICVLAGVTVALVVSNTSARLPGNTGSGGVTLSPGQQVQRELAQAAVLEQQGQLTEALQVYQQVLAQDPGNPDALSEAGWLEFEAGVLGGDEKSLEQGEAQEQSAVTADPGLLSARAFLGSMYFVEGEVAQAVVQYSQFLADKPTAAEMSPFLPDIRKAFSETKTPLPTVAATKNPSVPATKTSGP
jgi:cytochrome c-type biogenesis protein CcmH/NrfG